MIVPRFPQDRCVILTDAGIESLLACAMASEQQQIAAADPSILLPACWSWDGHDEIDLLISAIDPAIIQQAGLFGLDIFPDQALYPPDDIALHTVAERGLLQSRMLLEAAHLALRSGIRRVVWPVRAMHPGRTETMTQMVDEIATLIDRALLASRLVSLDASPDTAVEVVIETPFVDLSNEQIAEMALDIAAPIDACWWHNARSLERAQAEQRFWSSPLSTLSPLPEPKPTPRTHA